MKPTSEQLAGIAVSCCESFEALVGTEPKCAFLSYSTDGGGSGEVILDKNVISQPGGFDGCATYLDQAPLREQKVLDALAEAGIELESIDAISGRGVGIQNCIGGTYEINDKAVEDAANDVTGIHHPAILGIVISADLGKKLGVSAY